MLKALEREPSQRFATVREMARALLPFASDHIRPVWQGRFGTPSSAGARSTEALSVVACPSPASGSGVGLTKVLPSSETRPPRAELGAGKAPHTTLGQSATEVAVGPNTAGFGGGNKTKRNVLIVAVSLTAVAVAAFFALGRSSPSSTGMPASATQAPRAAVTPPQIPEAIPAAPLPVPVVQNVAPAAPPPKVPVPEPVAAPAPEKAQAVRKDADAVKLKRRQPAPPKAAPKHTEDIF